MTETWERAHRALLRIAGRRAVLDREEGRWLLVAYRERAHERLGFGSFVEYVERLLGHGPVGTGAVMSVCCAPAEPGSPGAPSPRARPASGAVV